MSAYDNDLSEETQAQIQKIKVELEAAKEDLEETQYDKFISDQKTLLDELYTEYELALNERLDNLDMLVSDVILSINDSAVNIDETLHSVSDKVGYTMSETMNSIWGQATENMNAQSAQRVQDVQNILATLVSNGAISQQNAQNIITALGSGNQQGVINASNIIGQLISNGTLAAQDASKLLNGLISNEGLKGALGTQAASLLAQLVANHSMDINDMTRITSALASGDTIERENAMNILKRMGANGVISEADRQLLTNALNSSTSPLGNTLTMYSSDFKTQSTAANKALNNISAYVDSLRTKAELEAQKAAEKAAAEAAAKKRLRKRLRNKLPQILPTQSHRQRCDHE